MSLLQKFPEYLQDHLRNALYGGALGDALGFLVELQTPQEILEFSKRLSLDKEGCIDWIQEMQPEDWITHQKYESGQISDDTQLSLLLVEALSEGEGAEYCHIFHQKLATAFQENKIYSYGHTTRDVAHSYMSNTEEPLGSLTSTSNGSVMRIAPLGVYFSEDLEAVAYEADKHSRSTHAHSVPCSAAQAQALAIAKLIQGDSVRSDHDQKEFIKSISEKISDMASQSLYVQLVNFIDKPIDEVKERILALDHKQSAGMQNGGISMHAMTCTMWSHYCFLNEPDDCWGTITNAISIGGDVDTVASMAGSLSAVYNQGKGLPTWSREWIKGFKTFALK